MTGSSQQAASDHAAVSAFTVNCERRALLDQRKSSVEFIQRPPLGAGDVTGLPFGFATHIEHADPILPQACLQSLYRHLGKFRKTKSLLLPRSAPTCEKAAQIFDTHSRQSHARFLNLLRRIGD